MNNFTCLYTLLTYICILIAEVYENGEDENPILNLGESLQYH